MLMPRDQHEGTPAAAMTRRLGDKELHIAPMLDVSTREFRFFMRLLTKRSVLWTEMVVCETLQYCDEKDWDMHLAFDDIDQVADIDGTAHPICCQLGGNVPSEAALATELVHRYGYDRVDLNAECPSDRVTGRREFGAALMKDVDTAVDMVEAMVKTAENHTGNTKTLPVSVKTRIGVDDEDSLEFLLKYIRQLVDAGCTRFVIHARKVYTKGLSPAQNRSVPPLNYQKVYALCQAFPHCEFWLNGGIRSLADARNVAYGSAIAAFDADGVAIIKEGTSKDDSKNSHHSVPCQVCNKEHGSCVAPSPHLSPDNLRGVMLGRLAMDNPCAFADADRFFSGEKENPCSSRRELIEKYASWLEQVYPRRCCDDDPTVTLGRRCLLNNGNSIPRIRDFCSVCKEYYENRDAGVGMVDDENSALCNDNNKLDDSKYSMSEVRHRRHARKCPGAKIVSSVIDRPLKPVLGIFFNMPGNAKFRREIHRLSRDMTVRNCGPGYILRKAVECISPEILDQEFVKVHGVEE